MKRMYFITVLILTISTASFSKEFVSSGQTHSTFGDYKIEIADNKLTINGKQLNTYQISYQNTNMIITVTIMEDKKCKKYITLSEKLTVQYVFCKKRFGVEKLEKIFNIDGYLTTYEALNTNEFFYQKVLTTGERGDKENMQLLAAYFPFLIRGTGRLIGDV